MDNVKQLNNMRGLAIMANLCRDLLKYGIKINDVEIEDREKTYPIELDILLRYNPHLRDYTTSDNSVIGRLVQWLKMLYCRINGDDWTLIYIFYPTELKEQIVLRKDGSEKTFGKNDADLIIANMMEQDQNIHIITDKLYDLHVGRKKPKFANEKEYLLKRWQQETGKNIPSFMENIDNIIDNLISEGIVSRTRSNAINILNLKTSKIHAFAKQLGLDSDMMEVSSPDELSTRIEIQFGNNKLFEKSQIVSVTIYDADDYVVMLPAAIAIAYDLENYNKFRRLIDVKSFLVKLNKLIN